MSVLIFTGKGGVGKTTCAAATAYAIAANGGRACVVSSDPAHSLGDCLDTRLDGAPKEVTQGLFAMELDARGEMETRFGEVRRTILAGMRTAGLDAPLAAEMVEFPGSEELFALLRIAELRDDGAFDCLIMDCAPTGNTLRFLNFSEFLDPIKRALRIERLYQRLTSPVSRAFGKAGPTKAYYDSVFSTFDKLEKTRTGMLEDDTRFRVVLNPERLAIAESQRAISFLNVGGFSVDALIVNRILPPSVEDPFFDAWRRSHDRHVEQIRDEFYPLSIFEIALEREEVVGLERIAQLAEKMYDGVDAAAPLTTERPFDLATEGDEYCFRIRMPNIARAEVELEQSAAGVHVKIGPYERRLHLPSALTERAVTSAGYDGRFLTLRFATSVTL